MPLVEFTLIDDQLNAMPINLMFDDDINAYKGSVHVDSFNFPLLTNLVKLQEINNTMNTSHEILFSCNEQNIIRIFLYKETQQMYTDKYRSLCLNEDKIYHILHTHNCDEAILCYSKNKFDFFYHNDVSKNSLLKSIFSWCTSTHVMFMFCFILLYSVTDFLF